MMDKDIFIKLCAYCIAKYMHGQFRQAKDYWLVIFDNRPRINKRGNIHGTESRKIKKVILPEGVKESYTPDDFDAPYGGDWLGLPWWLKDTGYEKEDEQELREAPTESENGSEEIDVKNIDGFVYIKRCRTLNETMQRILSMIDTESAIYRENKSNRKNNFTFYVDGGRIHIAHRDNPVLITKKK